MKNESWENVNMNVLFNIPNDNKLVIMSTPNSNFYSSSSIILYGLMSFCCLMKKEPEILETTGLYIKYNPCFEEIYTHLFKKNNDYMIDNETICMLQNYTIDDGQFKNYKTLNYELFNKFIKKYFNPSDEINSIISKIENIYIQQYNYENICTLFYRGCDKSTETTICDYDEIIKKAKELMVSNPNIVFLLQSDEIEFIERMSLEFKNSFYFSSEFSIPIKKNTYINNVEPFTREHNYIYGKNFLAITVVMSRCKYIICTTGNCSIWITFFRGNANNVHQFLHDKWV